MSLDMDGAISLRVSLPPAPQCGAFMRYSLTTDGNALAPLIMFTDFTYLFGLYVDSDGVTLRLSDPYPWTQQPGNAGLGALSLATWVSLALTRDASRQYTPYLNGVAGTPFTLPDPQGDITQMWFSGDSVQFNDGLCAHIVTVPRAISGTEVAQMHASATPWLVLPDAYPFVVGSGPNYDAAKTVTGTASGVAWNEGVSSYSTDNPTFGAALQGTAVLDIA